MKLDSFTRAYIEAIFFTESGDEITSDHSISDFSPCTMEKIISDCEKFQSENEIPEYNNAQYSDSEMAGHDFWLTRNHHGAGFWDRGLGEVGQKLTEASYAFGEVFAYLGDDGKIHLS